MHRPRPAADPPFVGVICLLDQASGYEVILRVERPVVDSETVAVERVRLGKETVHDSETVSGEVRKEQIDFDGPEPPLSGPAAVRRPGPDGCPGGAALFWARD